MGLAATWWQETKEYLDCLSVICCSCILLGFIVAKAPQLAIELYKGSPFAVAFVPLNPCVSHQLPNGFLIALFWCIKGLSVPHPIPLRHQMLKVALSGNEGQATSNCKASCSYAINGPCGHQSRGHCRSCCPDKGKVWGQNEPQQLGLGSYVWQHGTSASGSAPAGHPLLLVERCRNGCHLQHCWTLTQALRGDSVTSIEPLILPLYLVDLRAFQCRLEVNKCPGALRLDFYVAMHLLQPPVAIQ